MMGLDCATQGTMTVAGKKLVVIEKDDQGKPDIGKSLLAAASRPTAGCSGSASCSCCRSITFRAA